MAVAGLAWVYQFSSYTAANAQGILADTSSFPWTLTLPASPSNGNEVGICDNNGTFALNNLTIDKNGSLIQNLSENMICNYPDAIFSLIYTPTQGWKIRGS